MSTRRFALVFLTVGLAAKGSLLLLWRSFHDPAVGVLLTDCDPAAVAFAEWATSLAFDPRRIYPGPSESAFFEAMLLVGAGVECLIIGLVFKLLVDRYGRNQNRPGR